MGKAFGETGWEVIYLDTDPKTDANTHEGILTWDHSTYPPGRFHAILARPLLHAVLLCPPRRENTS